jgi:Carboxypeptidase regulatory-like domain
LAIRRSYALLVTAALIAAAFAAPATAPAGATTLPGLITGWVDAGTTGAALPGVCVYAIAITGYPGAWTALGPQYDATTGASGTYELSVPVGTYGLRFDPSCDNTVTSWYATQYYLGQPDLESVNAISASATAPATAINVALVAGFSVSGTVTGPWAPNGTANVCVMADDAAGGEVGLASTSSDGTFSIGSLPAGNYQVYFDPTCGGARASRYAPQYYPGQALRASAAELQIGADVDGIDARLMKEATLSGTVAAPGAANNAGVCVYALAVGGQLARRNVTDEMGSYAIPNLAAGSYKVIFDPSCGGSQTSYFSSRQYRRTVSVAPGQAYTGINGTLTLRSGPKLSIGRTSLPVGKVYSSYFAALPMAGPSAEESDYAWHVTGLPRGLHSSSSSVAEAIVGRPQVAGRFRVTTTVTTSGAVPALAARRTFSLVVKPAVTERPAPQVRGGGA